MVKKLLMLAGVGILALVVGFSARLYSEGGLPGTVLANALSKNNTATSGKYKGTLTVTPDGVTPLTLNFSGANDVTDIKNPKGSASLSTTLPDTPDVKQLIEPGSVELEFRFFGSILYVQLAALPKTLFDLSPIIGEWVKIDPASVTALTGQPTQTPEISPEQLAELKDIVATGNVVRYIGTLASTEINGQAMHHYGISVDREALIVLLPKLIAWSHKVSGQAAEPDEAQIISKVIDGLRRLPADQYPKGEIFIGRADGFIHRLILGAKIEPGPVPGIGTNVVSPPHITFSVDVTYSDFNQPVTIEEPIAAISFEEAIGRVLAATQRPAANVGYQDIVDWVQSISAPARAGIEAAASLRENLYETKRTKEQYQLYDRCANYIVSQAVRNISNAELDALRSRTAAFKTLSLNTNETDNAALRQDLVVSLQSEYIMPGVIDSVGLETVLTIDSVMGGTATPASPTTSKAACRTLPVPSQYK